MVLDYAEMVGAVFAGEEGVRLLQKAFGVAVVAYFPCHGADEREGNEAPRIKVRHKDERRCDHDRAPGEDAAGDAAFILHKKMLEGTVKDDADDVADIVKRGEQQHLGYADEPEKIERRDRAV